MTVISGASTGQVVVAETAPVASGAGAAAGVPTHLAEEEEERLLNAEAIGQEEEAGHAVGTAAAALPPMAHLAADTCATALAESFLLAQKGLNTVREIDGKVGMTRRLQPAAERLSVKAHELDDQLRIREGLRDAADRAKVSAAVLSGRAAELSGQLLRQNPALAQGAQKTSKVFKLAEAWGKRTLEAAKEKIESRGGVLPGSARQEGSGGVAEPLMGGSAVPLSPGEEEVNIQL